MINNQSKYLNQRKLKASQVRIETDQVLNITSIFKKAITPKAINDKLPTNPFYSGDTSPRTEATVSKKKERKAKRKLYKPIERKFRQFTSHSNKRNRFEPTQASHGIKVAYTAQIQNFTVKSKKESTSLVNTTRSNFVNS